MTTGVAYRPNLRPHAEEALLERFRALHGLETDASRRLANLRPLVVETVGEAALEAALRDIARGDGGELALAHVPGGSAQVAELLGVAGRSRSTRTLTCPKLAPFDTAWPAAIGGEPMAAGL